MYQPGPALAGSVICVQYADASAPAPVPCPGHTGSVIHGQCTETSARLFTRPKRRPSTRRAGGTTTSCDDTFTSSAASMCTANTTCSTGSTRTTTRPSSSFPRHGHLTHRTEPIDGRPAHWARRAGGVRPGFGRRVAGAYTHPLLSST